MKWVAAVVALAAVVVVWVMAVTAQRYHRPHVSPPAPGRLSDPMEVVQAGADSDSAAVADGDPRFAEALRYRRDRNYSQCVTLLKSILVSKPSDVAARRLLAKVYLQQKDMVGAERECRAILQLEPSANDHNNLGLVLYDRRDLSGAKQEYEAALRLDPNNYLAHSNLASLYYGSGDLARSETELLALRRAYPADTYAYLSLCVLYQRQGQLDQAAAVCRAYLDSPYARKRKNEARLWAELGMVLYEKNDLEAAENALRQAIAGCHRLDLLLHDDAKRMASIEFVAQTTLGDVLRDKGQLKEALSAYEAAAHCDDPAAPDAEIRAKIASLRQATR